MMIPLGCSIETWASSLFIDFPSDNIPILLNPDQWQEWGDQLLQEDTFANANCPGTASFKDWQAWAQSVYYTVMDNQ